MTLDLCCGSGDIIFPSKAQICAQWKTSDHKSGRGAFYDKDYITTLYKS